MLKCPFFVGEILDNDLVNGAFIIIEDNDGDFLFDLKIWQ